MLGHLFFFDSMVPSFYVDPKKRIKRNAVSLLSAPCHKIELNMKTWQKSMPVIKNNNEIQTLKKNDLKPSI